jgi:hypothetical protein
MQIMNGKNFFPAARGACRFLSGRSDDAADGGWNLYANFCRCSNKQVNSHTPPPITHRVSRDVLKGGLKGKVFIDMSRKYIEGLFKYFLVEFLWKTRND